MCASYERVLNDIYTDGCKEKKYRLSDFFNRWWDEYAQHPAEYITPEQYKAVNAIRVCRTTTLGDRYIRLSRLWGSTGNQP